MIGATLVAWLWMAGQSGTVSLTDSGNFSAYSLVTPNPSCEENGWISIARDDGTYDKIAVCHDGRWHRYSPPAEHVVEIRTKREDHGMLPERKYNADGTVAEGICPAGDIVEDPSACQSNPCITIYLPPRCVHVTREIWIDNVKWGVLKETESK